MTKLIQSNQKNELSAVDPFEQMFSLRNDIDKMFHSFFNGSFPSIHMPVQSLALQPKINIQETDSSVIVTADVPGLDEKSVDVEISGNTIRISGSHESKKHSGGPNDNYYRMERSSGSFSRSLELPSGCNTDSADAHIEHGVLTINIPKVVTKTEKKKLTVKKK